MLQRTTRIALLVPLLLLTTAPADVPDPEVERIRAHLTTVLGELRAAPTDHLTVPRREARRETIEWLAEYRDTGVFPHNHLRPGERVPVFVDPHGTPCAVGYLLLRSGEVDLVRRVVRTDNLVRVPELAGDQELAAWLERRGLTLDEAARIQPTYDGFPGVETNSAHGDATVAVSIATASFAALSELTAPNPDRFEWAGALTLTAMAGHVGLLALSAVDDGESDAWETGVNIGGAVLGAWIARRRFRARSERADSQERVTRAFQPILGSDGGSLVVGLRVRH